MPKFSELSWRDYIAIEIVGQLAPTMDAPDAAKAAYQYTDAMLKEASKRDPIEFVATVALFQIWELLGVDNQTAAILRAGLGRAREKS